MKKYLVEFLGTFILVLTIGMVVVEPVLGYMGPLVIGAVLIGLIYAGAGISGAHYNPAVTITFWLRGVFSRTEILPYIISQVIAAIAAGFTVLYIKGGPLVETMDLNVVPTFLVEYIFTLLLCFVILIVATSPKTKGNRYYGVAIGMVVITGAYFAGGISGGAFNPAVAAGFITMGTASIQHIWIFVLANILGGITAPVLYKHLSSENI